MTKPNRAWLILSLVMFLMIATSTVGGMLFRHLFKGAPPIILWIWFSQFVTIIFPAILFITIRDKQISIKQYLRLNKFDLSLVPYLLILPICANIFSGIVSMPLTYVLTKIFGQAPQQVPQVYGLYTTILMIFSVCIVAPVIEETLNRGVILSEFRKNGAIYAMVLGGIAFGMLHFRIQNIVQISILGILLSWTALKTSSLYAAIIMHMANNAFAYTAQLLMERWEFIPKNMVVLTQKQQIVGLSILLVEFILFVAFPVLVYFFNKKTNISNPNWKQRFEVEEKQTFKLSVLNLLTVALFIGFCIAQTIIKN